MWEIKKSIGRPEIAKGGVPSKILGRAGKREIVSYQSEIQDVFGGLDHKRRANSKNQKVYYSLINKYCITSQGQLWVQEERRELFKGLQGGNTFTKINWFRPKFHVQRPIFNQMSNSTLFHAIRRITQGTQNKDWFLRKPLLFHLPSRATSKICKENTILLSQNAHISG